VRFIRVWLVYSSKAALKTRGKLDRIVLGGVELMMQARASVVEVGWQESQSGEC
jgi:hypothetical protein